MKYLLPIPCFVACCLSVFGDDAKIDQLASQLQRVPPRSAEQSLKTIRLTNGFRAQLVASEPLVRDPVAVAFDEAGRMFVCELPQYNGYAADAPPPKGTVRLLIDSDDDGVCDRSTVYADDLDYPTGIACWDGGVFVGLAPDLIYLKDLDNDGTADVRRVILTGFGKDKAGESHLNSFQWGPDNRLYISTGLAGGKVSVPDNPSFAPLEVRGRGVILDPRDLTRFELTSGGGQFGMCIDDAGRRYVCSNSVPAQILMYDDRYLARNPQVRARPAAVDIVPDGKFTRLFRISPDEPWRRLRTELRKKGRFRGSDEGGRPFGFFTAATGITVYRGDAWPEEYRGQLFVGDVANNLIWRARLDFQSLQPVARRADPDSEFFASQDIWLRPVQMANAPDGTMYVLDMYRELIEGAAFLPPEFLKYVNAVGGNDRGRIYRLLPPDFRRRQTPNLAALSTADLVRLLDHSNAWHRDTASRLLYQRQDQTAVEPLLKLARHARSSMGKICALYSLRGIDALSESLLLQTIEDPSPLVRIHSLRLAEPFAQSSAIVSAAVCRHAADTDVHVRYQTAFSLGSCSSADSRDALAALFVTDGHDEWFQLAIAASLDHGADRVLQILSKNASVRQSKHGRMFLHRLAAMIGENNRPGELAVALTVVRDLASEDTELSQQLLQQMLATQPESRRSLILQDAGNQVGRLLKEHLDAARQNVTNKSLAVDVRGEALTTLRILPLQEWRPLIEDLLAKDQPGELQARLIRTLGEYSEDLVADIILEHWPEFVPSVRIQAAETLLSRPNWGVKFLQAVRTKQIGRTALSAARLQLLTQHPVQEVARAATLLAQQSETNRRRGDVIQKYQAALTLDADPEAGRAVFLKNCAVCHRLDGQGNQAGADLRGIRNRGMAAVLMNILDPNREVKPQFFTYVVVTKKGRTLTGMIDQETANSLTIRQADGKTVTVLRRDIDELHSSGLSFMPEGLEKQISVQQMADLLAYLDSIR